MLVALRRPAPSVGEIEQTCARTLGVRDAVLLPSVRSGIYLVLKAVSGPGGLVVGPAYTCAVVHQAMRASGLRTRFIDAAPRHFSMACDQLLSAMEPGCCVILCELYGIPTGQDVLEATRALRPAVRILDTATNIPDPVRLGRMESTDVAMFSFGKGKWMSAGWGGLACFQDEGLCQQIREMRDASATRGTVLQHQRNALAVLARVAKRWRTVYGLAKTSGAALSFVRGNASARKEASRSSRAVDVIEKFTAEWTRLPGPFNRKLVLHNLRHGETTAEIHRRLTETYVACLKDTEVVQGVDLEALPRNGFPIRVPPQLRSPVQDYLWRRGIDVGRQFPFPESLSPAVYPNAAQASAEVLTLPFGEHISPKDVERISRTVLESLQDANRRARAMGEFMSKLRERLRLVALMYHDVVEAGEISGFQVPSAGAYRLELPQFLSHLEAIEKGPLPPRTVFDVMQGADRRGLLLTFDDGGKSAVRVADLLDARGWRGHFFLTTSLIDTAGFVTRRDILDLVVAAATSSARIPTRTRISAIILQTMKCSPSGGQVARCWPTSSAPR